MSEIIERLHPEFTNDQCSMQDREHYESGDFYYLNATVIYPTHGERGSSRTISVPWAKRVTTDPTRSESGAAFFRPSGVGYWSIDGQYDLLPRSICMQAPDGEGYLIFKGAANALQTNFPPLINPKISERKQELGHLVLWGVEKQEAMRYFETLVSDRGIAIMNDPNFSTTIDRVVKRQGDFIVIKLDEVVVPTSETESKIMPFIDAYLKPWEVHDEIRQQQIRLMAFYLNNQWPKDDFDQALIVKRFYETVGFYQIVEQSRFPFRTDVMVFIANPIECCLRAESIQNEPDMIDYQRRYLTWVFEELLRGIGITRKIDTSLIDVSISPIEAIQDDQSRPFSKSRINQFTATEIDIIKRHLRVEQLLQINGINFWFQLLNQLTEKEKDTIGEWFTGQIDKMAEIYVNYLSLGIMPAQCLGKKDAFAGSISDWADFSPLSDFMLSDLTAGSSYQPRTTLSIQNAFDTANDQLGSVALILGLSQKTTEQIFESKVFDYVFQLLKQFGGIFCSGITSNRSVGWAYQKFNQFALNSPSTLPSPIAAAIRCYLEQ